MQLILDFPKETLIKSESALLLARAYEDGNYAVILAEFKRLYAEKKTGTLSSLGWTYCVFRKHFLTFVSYSLFSDQAMPCFRGTTSARWMVSEGNEIEKERCVEAAELMPPEQLPIAREIVRQCKEQYRRGY